MWCKIRNYFSVFFGSQSAYTLGMIIWSWYTAIFSFFIGGAAWLDQDKYFNSAAYDWVGQIMPLKLWAVVWLIPIIYHVLAMLNARTPFFAAKHFRRQFATFAFIQGIWMISILVLTFQGSLTAITAVLIWSGVTIATLSLLYLTPMYKPGVAGLSRTNNSDRDTGWRRFIQW